MQEKIFIRVLAGSEGLIIACDLSIFVHSNKGIHSVDTKHFCTRKLERSQVSKSLSHGEGHTHRSELAFQMTWKGLLPKLNIIFEFVRRITVNASGAI
jgi:hypothetical protein